MLSGKRRGQKSKKQADAKKPEKHGDLSWRR
jgi:hypothetical protein